MSPEKKSEMRKEIFSGMTHRVLKSEKDVRSIVKDILEKKKVERMEEEKTPKKKKK